MGRRARNLLNLEALKRSFFENAGLSDALAGGKAAIKLETVAAATGLDIGRAPAKPRRKSTTATERTQGRS